jgi:hypothetical protein
MSRSHTRLHPLIGNGVEWAVQALDLIGCTNIAIVGLDTLAHVEEVAEDLVEDLDVCPFPGKIQTLDPQSTLGPCPKCLSQSHSRGQTSLSTCEMRMHSPELQPPLARYRCSYHRWTLGNHWKMTCNVAGGEA